MKLKKLFFSILSVGILWLTSFSSADIYTWSFVDWSFNYKATFNSSSSYSYIYSVENPFNVFDSGVSNRVKFCAYFSWWDWSIWLNVNFSILSNSSHSFSSLSPYSTNFPWQAVNNSCYTFNMNFSSNYTFVRWNYISLLLFPNSSWDFPYTFDDVLNLSWYYTFESDLISLSSSPVDCSQDSNYLQCLEDKNLLIWQVSTLSGNLNSCQSDLSSCLNGVDVSYQACIENLSWCQSDLTNMTNYNDSLSLQLNECLAELPIPCEWTGCEDTIITDQRFSFFRENDWERFSLPVANNVFLPQWFRAYVDSGVVAITRIQEKPDPVLAEWSFSEVNSLFFHFFKSVIIVLFFALFLWFIKTLIYPLFIQNKKD